MVIIPIRRQKKWEKIVDLLGIEPGTSGSKSYALPLSYRFLIVTEAHFSAK